MGTSVGIDYFLTTDEFRHKGIRKLNPPLSSFPVYAYIHRKHLDLVAPLETVLREMKSDGTYDAMLRQALPDLDR